MHLAEFTLDHKEAVWKIPPETRVLRIDCNITLSMAKEIIMRCRELDRIIYSGSAFYATPREAKDYLSAEIYHVTVEGEIEQHGVPENIAKEIRELYARGDTNLDLLSLQFKISKEKVWHIIHGKPLAHAKKEVDEK